MTPALLRTIARKTLRIFIIVYLILLPVSIVVAYFMREHKIAVDGHALSFPLFALLIAGIVLAYLFFLAVIGFTIVLFLWSLYDLMKSEFTHTHNKILWFVLIILFPLLGTIFYVLISPEQKIKIEPAQKL